MKSGSLESFLEQLFSATSNHERVDLLQRHLADLGFEHFAYAAVPKITEGSTLELIRENNLPADWSEDYVAGGYATHDPRILHCLTGALNPLRWSRLLKQPKNNQEFQLNNLSSDHQLDTGVTVPLHGNRDFLSGISLMGHRGAKHSEIEDSFIKHEAVIRGYTRLFDAFQDMADSAVRHYRITPRQRELCKWIAAGLRVEQVCEKMGFSDTTYRYHLNGLKQRLQVRTPEAAVAKAVRLGII